MTQEARNLESEPLSEQQRNDARVYGMQAHRRLGKGTFESCRMGSGVRRYPRRLGTRRLTDRCVAPQAIVLRSRSDGLHRAESARGPSFSG